MRNMFFLLIMVMTMLSCVSAQPLHSGVKQRVTIVTTSNNKHGHKKPKKVVVKKVVVGTRVKHRPVNSIVINFNKVPFFYSKGVFYKKCSNDEYEVVKPQKGMIVPELPDYNVDEVMINGETLFLFDGTLYKQIPTSEGLQYEVTGFVS